MTSVAVSDNPLVLSQNRMLRLLTLLLFYFTQGFPVGVFFYAIPAWMAANGMGAGETAAVVAAASLPWTLKLANGFILDRYAYLPMGRRRAWIIGAQSLIVIGFLTVAVLAPAYSDVALLSALGFVCNMAVTVQDVGIDSLAVDIMPEDERAKAGGIMFGAQMLGIAAATGMTGALLDAAGITTALAVSSLIPASVALYGIVIRERPGEKRLPWSPGTAHPRNLDIQADRWGPLLKRGLVAIIVPASLLLLPMLLMRALPDGAFDSFGPIMTTQIGGWSLSEHTGTISSAQMAAGLSGLLIGGFLVDYIGAERSFRILWAIAALFMASIALGESLWIERWFLSYYIFGWSILATFLAIAMIPLAMRMCSPAVAATQFTIYMAVANFGRPLGAWLAAMLTGKGNDAALFWTIAGLFSLGFVLTLVIRFPERDAAEQETADPSGGLHPVRD